jgi:hypothetical protein
MNRWRVGEDRGSKETDGCPLTMTLKFTWNKTKRTLSHRKDTSASVLGECTMMI